MYKYIKTLIVILFLTMSANSWGGDIAPKIAIQDITINTSPKYGYPYITGFATNNSGKMLNYIRLSVNFYDAKALVDSQRESIKNLPANKNWKFKVHSMRYFDSYEIIKIED